MKYAQKKPIGYTIPLHIPVRLWSNVSIDLLKLVIVFTKCSVLHLNIPVDENHIVSISRLWMIVNSLLGFKFLIPVPDKFSAEQYTTTFDPHVDPTVEYPYYIVFDQDTLFTSLYFQCWTACKGIKLEPSTVYHLQTNGHSDIGNKEIIQVARAYQVEGKE